MSALLRRITKNDVLQSPSIARAKSAVFHTFHENKVKIITAKANMFDRTVGEERETNLYERRNDVPIFTASIFQAGHGLWMPGGGNDVHCQQQLGSRAFAHVYGKRLRNLRFRWRHGRCRQDCSRQHRLGLWNTGSWRNG